MTQEPTDKLRALFLAALMVMSVFAFTVSFAGTAAAGGNNMTLSQSDSDEAVESGQTFWQGQDLFVVDDPNAPNYADDKTLQIRSVNEDNELTGLVSEFTLDQDTKNLSTDNLDAGEYVITDGSNTVLFFNNTDDGAVTGEAATGTPNIDAAAWEVAVQSLSAEFDDDDLPVTTGDLATIEMTSNRGTYTVNVTAEGLDEDDLAEIFNNTANNDFVNGTDNDEDDDDSVQLNTSSDGTIEANFSRFDETGEFTFDFEVSDTTATASATVDVGEEDVEIDFTQSSFTEETGDIVEISIEMEDTTEAFIFVGGEDVNYLERVHVVDDNEDGEVTLSMNTFLAGTDAQAGAPNNNSSTTGDVQDNAFEVTSEDDAFGDTGDNGVLRFNSSDEDFEGDSLSGVDISSWLTSPLTDGTYDLAVASSKDLAVNDDDEISFPDEEDVATLNLQERSTDGLSLWSLPQGQAAFDTDELSEEIEERQRTRRIAIGDRMVVQVNASGLYGYVEDETMTDILSQNGLNFTAEQTNEASNQDPKLIDFAGAANNDEAQLYTDPGNNTFYVVLDFGDLPTDRSDVADGENYDIAFQVGVAEADPGIDYNGADDIEENPYVDDDQEEIVGSSFSVQDADAEFSGLNDEEELDLSVSESVVVRGTTTVAPGTNLSVRIRSPGNFLITAEDVEVTSDRRWSATFDLSDVEAGTNFTATVRRGGTTISDEVDGQVLGAATASVTFNDQDSPRGVAVVVDSVTMSRGGFIAIHSGSASGPVIGSSKFLSAGTHNNVRIALDEQISEDTTLVAMPHLDDNFNNVYDFPEADAPYTADGSPVTDSAEVSYVEERTVTVEGDTPTPMIMTRTVQAQSPTPREVERTVVVTKTATPGQPGFGVAIAVVALLAAALLAIRRRD